MNNNVLTFESVGDMPTTSIQNFSSLEAKQAVNLCYGINQSK